MTKTQMFDLISVSVFNDLMVEKFKDIDLAKPIDIPIATYAKVSCKVAEIFIAEREKLPVAELGETELG